MAGHAASRAESRAAAPGLAVARKRWSVSADHDGSVLVTDRGADPQPDPDRATGAARGWRRLRRTGLVFLSRAPARISSQLWGYAANSTCRRPAQQTRSRTSDSSCGRLRGCASGCPTGPFIGRGRPLSRPGSPPPWKATAFSSCGVTRTAKKSYDSRNLWRPALVRIETQTRAAIFNVKLCSMRTLATYQLFVDGGNARGVTVSSVTAALGIEPSRPPLSASCWQLSSADGPVDGVELEVHVSRLLTFWNRSAAKSGGSRVRDALPGGFATSARTLPSMLSSWTVICSRVS